MSKAAKWRAVATTVSPDGVVAVSITTFETKAKALEFASKFLDTVGTRYKHADVEVGRNPLA